MRYKDIKKFLKDIEDGTVTLTYIGHGNTPQGEFGDCAYKASNGWQIAVYNKINRWRYISSITDDKGQSLDYDSITDRIYDYQVSEEIGWKRYRIPGYMKYRCESCGKVLYTRTENVTPNAEYICQPCGGEFELPLKHCEACQNSLDKPEHDTTWRGELIVGLNDGRMPEYSYGRCGMCQMMDKYDFWNDQSI